MAVIKGRECCYWKKPACTWKHCNEITAHNLLGPDRKAIMEEKKCGGFAAERFFEGLIKELGEEDGENFATFLMAFIKKGSKVLNDTRSNRKRKHP